MSNSAPAPAAPAAAAQNATPAPSVPPEPTALHDFQRMSPEQFRARLQSERDAAYRAFLKDVGVDKLEDIKNRFAKATELEQAQMTELEKWQKRAAEFEPHVKRAATFEASIKKYLEAEEAAIPEAKRGLLDLAPEQPEARLEWLAKAKAQKLFADAVATATAPPEPPREPKPATTLAPPGPSTPKPAGTVDPYEQWQTLKAEDPFKAAQFYNKHRTAIQRRLAGAG